MIDGDTSRNNQVKNHMNIDIKIGVKMVNIYVYF